MAEMEVQETAETHKASLSWDLKPTYHYFTHIPLAKTSPWASPNSKGGDIALITWQKESNHIVNREG
jgi:hypothetical protein